jgi:hypothetical protein
MKSRSVAKSRRHPQWINPRNWGISVRSAVVSASIVFVAVALASVCLVGILYHSLLVGVDEAAASHEQHPHSVRYHSAPLRPGAYGGQTADHAGADFSQSAALEGTLWKCFQLRVPIRLRDNGCGPAT